jgi:hypothetical protein
MCVFLAGESKDLERYSSEEELSHKELLKAAEKCMTQLAKSQGLVKPRLVLISDNAKLRDSVIKGKFPPWITPDVVPVHLMSSKTSIAKSPALDLKHVPSAEEYIEVRAGSSHFGAPCIIFSGRKN